MERGRGSFIHIKGVRGSVGRPGLFERAERSQEAHARNVRRFMHAEQARRQPVSLEEAVERSRIEQIRERGLTPTEEASRLAKAVVFLVITGSSAGLISCGGSDAQDQRTPTGNAGTPAPEAGASPTAVPTEAPTVVPTPEATEALVPETSGKVLDLQGFLSSFQNLYGQVTLPAGTCSLDTINYLLNLNFQALDQYGDHAAFAELLATLAAEVYGIQEHFPNIIGADQLWADLEATSEPHYAIAAQNLGLPSPVQVAQESMEGWRFKAKFKPSIDKGHCGYSSSPAPKP